MLGKRKPLNVIKTNVFIMINKIIKNRQFGRINTVTLILKRENSIQRNNQIIRECVVGIIAINRKLKLI